MLNDVIWIGGSFQICVIVCDKLTVEYGRPRSATSDNVKIDVLVAVSAFPHSNSRTVFRGRGVSQRNVLRILRHHRFHPYHVSLHQELLPVDPCQGRNNNCSGPPAKINFEPPETEHTPDPFHLNSGSSRIKCTGQVIDFGNIFSIRSLCTLLAT